MTACHASATSPVRVRWIGDIDPDSPTLGLPVLPVVRRHMLYRAAPESGTYSHHGYLAAHDGVLYAAWSNHARDEDAPGQRVLWSLSTDEGQSWAPWAELFPPHDRVRSSTEQDRDRDRILIANGFAVADQALHAIAECHVLEGQRGFGRLARRITKQGDVGDIFWLTPNPPDPLPGFPRYPSAADPAYAGTARVLNAYLRQPEHWPSWEFLNHTCGATAADGHRLCEPTQAWRIPDGRRARLWRDLSRESGCLYVQVRPGTDPAWPDPVRADFPDAYSRATAGNLPDGTAYVLNNPGPDRKTLVLSLAADGVTFDRHSVVAHSPPPRRFEGRCKNPGYQYPHATVAGGRLWIIYSISKEDVEVEAFELNSSLYVG